MSNLASWCYENKMSLEEYKALERSIGEEAARLAAAASSLRKTGTGMDYPIEELVPPPVRLRYEERGLLGFLFAALAGRGVEFYDNRSLYRI